MNTNAGISLFAVTSFAGRVGPSRCHLLKEVEVNLAELADGAESTSLWGPGANSGNEAGEFFVQMALSHPEHRELLRRLAEPPPTSTPALVLREVGDGGGIDLAAWFAGDDPTLLLVDCKRFDTSVGLADMQKQLGQAMRLAAGVLPNFQVGTASFRTKLVLLRGYRPGLKPPVPRAPRPGWRGEDGNLRLVPPPEWWGYIPFRKETKHYVAMGKFEALERNRDAADLFRAVTKGKGPEPTPGIPDSAQRHDLLPGLNAQVIRGEDWAWADVHPSTKLQRRALVDGAFRDGVEQRIALLRQRAEGVEGWQYLGEENSMGVMRLNWKHTGKPPLGSSAGEVLDQFVGVVLRLLEDEEPGKCAGPGRTS